MKTELMHAKGLSLVTENGTLLHNGSFSVYEGEILAFCQTSQLPSFFLAILSNPGAHNEGSVYYMGRPVGRNNPVDYSYVAGLDVLLDTLSIIDNLYALVGRTHSFFYNPRTAETIVRETLKQLELNVDIFCHVGDLTVSQKYMLELAKAIIRGSKLIVLENFSHCLSVDDYAWIIKILVKYSRKGRTFVLLSNEDNFLISKCDRVYFCRGTSIADLIFNDEYSHEIFPKIMYGNHEVVFKHRDKCAVSDKVAFEIDLPKALYANGTFKVHKGELFGIFDLFGTLADPVYNAFFTAFPYKVDGKVCNSYPSAVKNGLAVISPHRKGIQFDTFTPEENLVFPVLRKISRFGVINRRMLNYCSMLYLPKLSEKVGSKEKELEQLKMLFYRWMLTNPKVIVIDNPSLDLESNQQKEIEAMFQEAISIGCSIILISSNTSIGMTMCDRFVILQKHDGAEGGIQESFS